MSNQLVITSGAKVRNLSGVLTGTSGVVSSVPYGGANGVATLDGSGKVPLSQLPASVITYLGTWNAATNTPTLTNGVGDTGDLYICNVAGTVNFGAGPITFAVGDWVIYSGTTWEKSGGASGTVTSVAMTVPTGLSVTGSPITTSGTLAVDLAAGYTIPTTSFLSGLVPYTGATGNVNLGEYGLSGGYLGLDTTPTGTPTTLGTISWDDTYLTPKVITGTGATTLQVGQEEVVLIHNNTGSTLTDGQVVYINGSTGNLPTVALADASSETTSAATLGVVTESIANGSNGFITISGNVNGLNTLGYTAGDILWLSETAGQFTNVKPISPAHLVLIGYVVKVSGGNGSILVKIQNTQELEECSDVLFTSLANNDILAYESSTDLWKNKTIANVLGYTPANDSLVVKLAGTQTITGQKTFTSLIYANNNIVLPIAGSSSITYLANIAGTGITSSGANYIGFNTNNDFYFAKDNYHSCVFVSNNSAVNYYTLQDGSGTLAFTSDIPSLTNYVTLTGSQTITGIKTFTNEQLFGNGITLTGGYITYTSGSFNLTLNTNLLTANRNVFIKDGSGTLAFTSDIPSLSGYVQGSGTTNYISKWTASGTIGDSLLFDNGTNIGIGNTTPSYKFDVNGTGRYTGNLMVSSALGFAIGDITSYQRIQHNAGTFSFLTSANGNASITAGGATFSSSVGIGNTSPSYTLDVTGTGRFTGSLTGAGATFSSTINAAGAGGNIKLSGATTDGGLVVSASKFYIGDYATLTKGLVIDMSSGNVGIGTSSPASALDIYLPSVGTYFRGGSDNTARQLRMYSYTTTNAGDSHVIDAQSGTAVLAFATASTERMRITSGGSVCIGRTSAPSSAYKAAFQDAIMMAVSTNGNNMVNFFNQSDSYVASIVVNASSVAYNTSSDYRLKDDLKDFEGLSLLSNIKVYDFAWKLDNTRTYGVIAHELAEVLPNAVSGEKDGENIQGVDYSKLVPILVKAIQELSDKVSALENKS